MKLLYKGSFFEADDEPIQDATPAPAPDDSKYDSENNSGYLSGAKDDEEDEEVETPVDAGFSTAISRKTDPNVVVKRLKLHDKLYANIIDFIVANIGDVDELDNIRKSQQRIHDLFAEVELDVASEYNLLRRTNKDKLNIRTDSTMRKVNSMYRFFAYYLIKYDRYIVEWMEGMIKAKLFNDKSDIKSLNGAYSNIDLDLIDDIPTSELNAESFDILHRDSVFNRTLTNFFKDAGTLFDSLAGGAGLFNDMTAMMTAFKYGIMTEYKVPNEDGKEVKQTKMIPIEKTSEINEVMQLMLSIAATINSIVTVEAIRTKYIADYKLKLEKMNLTQAQISQNLNELASAIRGGTINSVEDFGKLLAKFKAVTTSDKEKENLGKITADMAKAYKYKIESLINRTRGQNDG